MTQRFKMTLVSETLYLASFIKFPILLGAAVLAYLGKGDAAIVVALVAFAIMMAEIYELRENTATLTRKKQGILIKSLVKALPEDKLVELAIECLGDAWEQIKQRDGGDRDPVIMANVAHERVSKTSGKKVSEDDFKLIFAKAEDVGHAAAELAKEQMMEAHGIDESKIKEMIAAAIENGDADMFAINPEEGTITPIKRNKPTKH
jgi:hypothetical protein